MTSSSTVAGWSTSPLSSRSAHSSRAQPSRIVRSGKRRAGASDGAGPAAASAAVSAAAAFVPSARPITPRRASSGNGFSRKSKAPRRMTRTAVSIVPCPEMTMIGTPGAWLRMRSTSSMPSISGIHTSTIASRGAACRSSSRARRPSGASSTSKPSSASTPRSVCRMFSSSSTTRIVSDIPHLHPTLGAGVRSVLGAGGELRRAPLNRKLEDEAAAAREVVPHADEPAVVRDDRGHDREPEAGALGLGRELVHQRLQLVDLLDDGARALVEHRAVGAEARGIAAAEPLRRELDRCERVLDLVRDAARNLPPGLHALHAQQMAHVLEEEDEATRAEDRKSTRLNSSHVAISYAVFCLKKKKKKKRVETKTRISKRSFTGKIMNVFRFRRRKQKRSKSNSKAIVKNQESLDITFIKRLVE